MYQQYTHFLIEVGRDNSLRRCNDPETRPSPPQDASMLSYIVVGWYVRPAISLGVNFIVVSSPVRRVLISPLTLVLQICFVNLLLVIPSTHPNYLNIVFCIMYFVYVYIIEVIKNLSIQLSTYLFIFMLHLPNLAVLMAGTLFNGKDPSNTGCYT